MSADSCSPSLGSTTWARHCSASLHSRLLQVFYSSELHGEHHLSASRTGLDSVRTPGASLLFEWRLGVVGIAQALAAATTISGARTNSSDNQDLQTVRAELAGSKRLVGTLPSQGSAVRSRLLLTLPVDPELTSGCKDWSGLSTHMHAAHDLTLQAWQWRCCGQSGAKPTIRESRGGQTGHARTQEISPGCNREERFIVLFHRRCSAMTTSLCAVLCDLERCSQLRKERVRFPHFSW